MVYHIFSTLKGQETSHPRSILLLASLAFTKTITSLQQVNGVLSLHMGGRAGIASRYSQSLLLISLHIASIFTSLPAGFANQQCSSLASCHLALDRNACNWACQNLVRDCGPGYPLVARVDGLAPIAEATSDSFVRHVQWQLHPVCRRTCPSDENPTMCTEMAWVVQQVKVG